MEIGEIQEVIDDGEIIPAENVTELKAIFTNKINFF